MDLEQPEFIIKILIIFLEFLYLKREGKCPTWFSPDIESNNLETLKSRCNKISDCIGIEDNGCALGCLTDHQYHLCKGTPVSWTSAFFNVITNGIFNFFEEAGQWFIDLGDFLGITAKKYVYLRTGNLTLLINTTISNVKISILSISS